MRRRGPWWLLCPRRWRQALATRAAMRRVVVGLPRSSRVAAAVALIEAEAHSARCWEWCSGCWGSSGGGVRIAAAPVRLINVCVPRRARECGTLPSMLFSFFFTLLSLADELLSAAARPVSRTCIGGENSLSASACKTLEASKQAKLAWLLPGDAQSVSASIDCLQIQPTAALPPPMQNSGWRCCLQEMLSELSTI